jgi:hypothetical protein
MATIGLSEAARLTGKPRSTIHRAMKAGRISYIVGPDGARLIDPAELERVFPCNTGSPVAWDKSQHAVHRPASAEIRELRARLADKDAVIDDLRRRLDAEAEERRRLTAILADQRTDSPVRRRWWWRR